MVSVNLIAALVLSLAITEFVHIIFEIWGAKQKVAWLKARIDGKPHGKWPININSLAKTLLLHTVMFVFFSAISYLAIISLSLDTTHILGAAAVVLVVAYSFATFGFDSYHGDIDELINRYPKK